MKQRADIRRRTRRSSATREALKEMPLDGKCGRASNLQPPTGELIALESFARNPLPNPSIRPPHGVLEP